MRHAEFFKTLLLPEPRRGNTDGNIGAGFLGRRQGEIGNAHRRQFNLDIHPVQQRPGNPRLIIRGAARAFLADVPRLARHAALARVHRGHELELRRIGDVIIGAGHNSLARLERLAQTFEDARLEFRKLIEKQHAVMGQRHFTGLGAKPAADKGGHRG